ncbi:MAG: hypothetical protein KDE50_01975 [Caldilineaceae bacterium]|nr:hypothetical protein [Caldilineaceae bacterium]MCB0138654.1 hypothetical protein [Caldilineaceae bacterium]
MAEAGYVVDVINIDDLTDIKAEHQVPHELQGCHTAIVDGYIIEGHVPADEIHRLLTEKPDMAGLAVPGMPIGSPGMEMGTTVEPFQVIAFDKDGNVEVFASYPR